MNFAPFMHNDLKSGGKFGWLELILSGSLDGIGTSLSICCRRVKVLKTDEGAEAGSVVVDNELFFVSDFIVGSGIIEEELSRCVSIVALSKG